MGTRTRSVEWYYTTGIPLSRMAWPRYAITVCARVCLFVAQVIMYGSTTATALLLNRLTATVTLTQLDGSSSSPAGDALSSRADTPLTSTLVTCATCNSNNMSVYSSSPRLSLSDCVCVTGADLYNGFCVAPLPSPVLSPTAGIVPVGTAVTAQSVTKYNDGMHENDLMFC